MERFINVKKDVKYVKNTYGDDVYEFESSTGTMFRFRFVTEIHGERGFQCKCRMLDHKRGYLSVLLDENTEYRIATYDLDADTDCTQSWDDIIRLVQLETPDGDTVTIQKSSTIPIINDIRHWSTIEKDQSLEVLVNAGITNTDSINLLKSLFVLQRDGVYKEILNHSRRDAVFIKDIRVLTVEEFNSKTSKEVRGMNVLIRL